MLEPALQRSPCPILVTLGLAMSVAYLQVRGCHGLDDSLYLQDA